MRYPTSCSSWWMCCCVRRTMAVSASELHCDGGLSVTTEREYSRASYRLGRSEGVWWKIVGQKTRRREAASVAQVASGGRFHSQRYRGGTSIIVESPWRWRRKLGRWLWQQSQPSADSPRRGDRLHPTSQEFGGYGKRDIHEMTLCWWCKRKKVSEYQSRSLTETAMCRFNQLMLVKISLCKYIGQIRRGNGICERDQQTEPPSSACQKALSVAITWPWNAVVWQYGVVRNGYIYWSLHDLHFNICKCQNA